MFVRTLRAAALPAAALMLVACATPNPVYNVVQAPVVANKANPSLDEIRQAIVRAGTQLTWQMKPTRPGHIVGTLAVRTHIAVVDIEYDRNSYSIKYRDSTNLNYDGTNIHRNYNGWIQNLDKAIKSQLSVL
jgi:hypothetical protein